MDPTATPWTRRQFLTRLGQMGGSAAVYRAMAAMGMVLIPPGYAGPPALPEGSGRGQRVIIIGAGIGGLTAALELGRAGYECVVLEASHRAGGRNLTVRRGDRIVETDSEQVCDFDEAPHLYFNAGPARIPYHHQALLSYCREFSIALEPFINDNRAGFLHAQTAFNGQPQRLQRFRIDFQGQIAELLSKAVARDALDHSLPAEEAQALLQFLGIWGELDAEHRYRGSGKAGWVGDAILQASEPHPPLPLTEIAKAPNWAWQGYFSDLWDQNPTMLQPVGGMDRIVRSFEERLSGVIRRNSPVTGVYNERKGVRVRYLDPATSKETELRGDWCIDNAPMQIAAGFDNNFSKRYRQAIKAVDMGKLFKIAFQGKRRFWEQDAQLYGGMSWTDQDIMQMWYPSHGFHQAKGIFLGSYTWDHEAGARLGRMSPAERLAAAIEQGGRIHPGYANEVEKGISIAWEKVPHLLGCAPEWGNEARKEHYEVARAAEGRHYFVGDQVSFYGGWQEGAIRSAHHAIEDIHRRQVNA